MRMMMESDGRDSFIWRQHGHGRLFVKVNISTFLSLDMIWGIRMSWPGEDRQQREIVQREKSWYHDKEAHYGWSPVRQGKCFQCGWAVELRTIKWLLTALFLDVYLNQQIHWLDKKLCMKTGRRCVSLGAEWSFITQYLARLVCFTTYFPRPLRNLLIMLQDSIWLRKWKIHLWFSVLNLELIFGRFTNNNNIEHM